MLCCKVYDIIFKDYTWNLVFWIAEVISLELARCIFHHFNNYDDDNDDDNDNNNNNNNNNFAVVEGKG